MIQRYDMRDNSRTYGEACWMELEDTGDWCRWSDVEPRHAEREAYRSLCMAMAAFCARLQGWEGVDERCQKEAMELLQRYKHLPPLPSEASK